MEKPDMSGMKDLLIPSFYKAMGDTGQRDGDLTISPDHDALVMRYGRRSQVLFTRNELEEDGWKQRCRPRMLAFLKGE